VILEELTIDVPSGARRRAEQAVLALGAQGLEVLELGEGRAGVRVWLPAGAVAQAARRALRRTLGEATVTSRRVEATWMPRARPRRVGRFVIASEPPKRPIAGRVVLTLDATTTFGDGTHPTTALAIEAVTRALEHRCVESVLDVGTGTGVLALVAAHLGAREVIATDVDPLARAAARANVARNGLADRVAVRTALPRRRFELVMANLYRDVLLELAPALAARVAPGGVLVVSGFAPASNDAVQARFEAEGLTRIDRRTRRGWSALTLERRPR
jgi:ribosomal protein L11 methyltransferase